MNGTDRDTLTALDTCIAGGGEVENFFELFAQKVFLIAIAYFLVPNVLVGNAYWMLWL